MACGRLRAPTGDQRRRSRSDLAFAARCTLRSRPPPMTRSWRRRPRHTFSFAGHGAAPLQETIRATNCNYCDPLHHCESEVEFSASICRRTSPSKRIRSYAPCAGAEGTARNARSRGTGLWPRRRRAGVSAVVVAAFLRAGRRKNCVQVVEHRLRFSRRYKPGTLDTNRGNVAAPLWNVAYKPIAILNVSRRPNSAAWRSAVPAHSDKMDQALKTGQRLGKRACWGGMNFRPLWVEEPQIQLLLMLSHSLRNHRGREKAILR